MSRRGLTLELPDVRSTDVDDKYRTLSNVLRAGLPEKFMTYTVTCGGCHRVVTRTDMRCRACDVDHRHNNVVHIRQKQECDSVSWVRDVIYVGIEDDRYDMRCDGCGSSLYEVGEDGEFIRCRC
jgi:hypothetical protein